MDPDDETPEQHPRDRAPAAFAPGVVVVGASAGGVEALKVLAGALPADLKLPVVVVLHISPGGSSVLPHILARAGRLPAVAVADGDPLLPGRIHVAPPDHHVAVDGDVLHLSRGPLENGHRPAIDPTMRSAALTHGAGAIAVVLSGTRDDGTAGAAAIKAAGGRVVVQDPDEAIFSAMPLNALAHVEADAVLPVGEIGRWLALAPREPARAVRSDAEGTRLATRFTCPDCGGVIFEESDGALVRYACSVGHSYAPESFASAQQDALEAALWLAVRSLEDRVELLTRMADRARDRLLDGAAEGFARQASETRRQAETIRNVVGFPGSEPANRQSG